MAKSFKLVSDDSGAYQLDEVIHPANEEDHGIFSNLIAAQSAAAQSFGVSRSDWQLVPGLKDHYFAFDKDGVRFELQIVRGYVKSVSLG